ncbi:MAG: imidazole glycerol phosphate synthase subunit HisH [Bacteroidales bacterium]
MSKKICIIDYGAGNLFSVQNALNKIGTNIVVSNDHKEIIKSDKIIFPGVGHAKTAMENLKKYKLDKLIPQLKQPVLGICLGMQLLCKNSEEGNTPGLNIFPDPVVQFNNKLKIPHMGWNNIEISEELIWANIPNNTFMYFVHSYYVPLSQYSIASCDYGKPFSAAIRKNNFIGIQFHPEKSGEIGLQVLKNFINH